MLAKALQPREDAVYQRGLISWQEPTAQLVKCALCSVRGIGSQGEVVDASLGRALNVEVHFLSPGALAVVGKGVFRFGDRAKAWTGPSRCTSPCRPEVLYYTMLYQFECFRMFCCFLFVCCSVILLYYTMLYNIVLSYSMLLCQDIVYHIIV